MQVVTSENFQQLVETGKVDEFKPPEAPKEEAKADAKDVKDGDRPRGEDGKFVKADEKVEEAAKAAVDEDADLPERVRRQIGKKHREKMEAEEFARDMHREKTAAETRAEALQRELDAVKGVKSGPDSSTDSKEPKQEDFNTVGEWAKAYAKYEVDREFKARDAQREQQRREAAAQEASNALDKRIAETIKEIPDYLEVIKDCELDAPPHVSVYIAESPIGPKIGYHFAKNPDDFDRIAKLSPIRAIAELGKLEGRLEKAPEPKAEPAKGAVATVSRAPSPITPLEGSSATVQRDPAKMTLQELRAYENEKRAAKARR